MHMHMQRVRVRVREELKIDCVLMQSESLHPAPSNVKLAIVRLHLALGRA